MEIADPRTCRSSSSLMVRMSRPSNRISPPTTEPLRPRNCMIASATVDLPQPDSPTMPCASPGMSSRLKSTTAGISPPRVKNETERFRHSTTGTGSLPFPPRAPGGTTGSALTVRSVPFPFIDSPPRIQSCSERSRRPSASRLRPRTRLVSARQGTRIMNGYCEM